ncbi:SGNH/GDSL hydrolase family protein [Gemelliphila palaticanis]|uniref:Lysophospholipase L1-like esterase n=1 Tax=Gemelliphila palaticanis TaxID=81950 RepID=A0ABX2SXR7_9BACL|nr:SGNH/GDSL hydrolase family protein [Gemella palaticanis]MBF0715073.1 hypothetical protein [Gemella palaticanis]NYS47003.1 hypothetical protein [Gemella palaticanis]
MRVLCIGDSNTWGYLPNGKRTEQRWTKILNKKYEILEEGLNGRYIYSMDKGRKNLSLSHTLEKILLKHNKVDLVLFMLGTNDFSISENKTVENIIEEINKIFNYTKEYYVSNLGYEPFIFFVTPPTINKDILNRGIVFGDFDKTSYDKCLSFNRKIEKFTYESNPDVYVINTNKYIETDSFDCIHLTEKEHNLLANILEKNIKNIME